uniref:Integrase, catalytic region, zinc finger, CCHC-type, peptidase aspartic, catalytic n=1 Tax=Tanacetum cinerariifolium TaxID=118510 RepID=A0A6L2K2F4_TANCI|nr:integrase, catalytic region, zinc finger, CCHC-type, peptidase aspartic, catalytic [Tanacetum cinerariifolium]GEV28418.1 integrase, catalytic region, zinc finger, CCHC-type, peptidase aspartic, catalytic [Tanacetum cinerariifolium]
MVVVQNVQGGQNRGSRNNARGKENGVVLDEEQLIFLASGQDNVVNEDVDDPPTMFMANLSSADPDYDEASPSYDSNILSEVPNHDNYHNAICEHHEVYEMHDDIQPNYVVDSHADYISDSIMISYAQYVKDNTEPVVQNNASSVSNDASMLIINEMPELTPQCDSVKEHTKVVEASLTAELAIYKEQVTLYERRTKFKLTVGIGYKNPLCLTRVKQVQPALYSGYEIIKSQLVPTIIYNSEDTLEIVEITRKKMNDKMKALLWTQNKINIRPPDYSTENFLATFTPQTQLTSKQIFWSKAVHNMKAEALEEQAKAAKPVKALTVYSPNTLAKLVPGVLPTKTQVKINIFALIQLFLEFEKTCKKRITPTGLTEGERGFEQTKECYLTEVIPFLKTLEGHFEDFVKPKVLVPGMYAIDVEPIPPRCRNNREVYLEYIKHLKESVATIYEIVEEAKVERHLDRVNQVRKPKQVNQVWKATGKVLTNVGYQWKPTGRIFTLGVQCPLTRTFSIRNDHFGAIKGYEDYVIGESVISRVYYMEGLGHNLFSIRKFCDSDLKVAFRKHSCHVRDTDGVELIKGSRL